MRSSCLPAVKQFHDFEFTFQPSLRRDQICRILDPKYPLGIIRGRTSVPRMADGGIRRVRADQKVRIRRVMRVSDSGPCAARPRSKG